MKKQKTLSRKLPREAARCQIKAREVSEETRQLQEIRRQIGRFKLKK